MAKKQEEKKEQEEERAQPHAFWSGVLAFGLVSVPVSLFPARGMTFSLKMVDDAGTPLKRRFVCEKDKKALDRNDIVRGYEISKDRFVVVEDEELEALDPKKSREIDLKRFVPMDDLNPVYFERAYFLVPDGDTSKAYRLLAKSMEEAKRAGIATFVMRGKEYLVAIIAERGILRAETLRFFDELRSAEAVGLPPREHAKKADIDRLRKAIESLKSKRLSRDQLVDHYQQRLMRHIEDKIKSGKDVLAAPEEVVEEREESENVIDLMEVLKERLRARQPHSAPRQENLERASKSELYERAQQLDIPGRSKMSKQQLIKALAKR